MNDDRCFKFLLLLSETKKIHGKCILKMRVANEVKQQ